MWQTDIMGRIDFPKAGTGYLIATLDDYSRFVPAGRWFATQGKMNVFAIWYESMIKHGLPEKMLQDEGSQYKETKVWQCRLPMVCQTVKDRTDLCQKSRNQRQDREILEICTDRFCSFCLGSKNT